MRAFLVVVTALGSALHAQSTPSLAHARQLFDTRNLDAAKQEYTALAKTLPNDVTPELYLGKIAL